MTHINQRRDTATNWVAANPVLQLGEVGWETNTRKSKLGDGVTAWNSLPYSTEPAPNLAAYATLASPVFTGNPTAPTPSTGDNDTSIATTAFVKAQGYVTNAELGTYAPLASPVFTGNPTAPTPSTSDNDTSVATTGFVKAQGYTTAAEVAGTYAPLASPVFTGNPTAPTPTAGDSDTSVATTAFVTGAIATASAGLAPLASPVFTGNPTAPTPSTGDNDTSVATTAFVKAQGYAVASALGTAAYVNTGTTVGTVPVLNSSGRIDVARLGSGTPDGTKYLRDDGTFAVPAGGGGGGGSGDVVGPGSSVSGNLPQFSGTSGKIISDSGVDFSDLAFVDSPVFTGNPTAPTPLTADNDTSIATTAYVKNQGYARTADLAAIALSGSALDLTATGTPSATTFLRGDDTWVEVSGMSEAEADLRYVSLTEGQTVAGLKNFADGVEFEDSVNFYGTVDFLGSAPDLNGLELLNLGSPTLGNSAATADYVDDGLATKAAVSHTHPVSDLTATGTRDATTLLRGDNTWVAIAGLGYAPTASPAFTGNPTAPTPSAGDNDTSIATTAFVATSFAPLASPVFTGVPVVPTAATATNTTQAASTAFVKAQGYATLASPTFTGAVNVNGTMDAVAVYEDGSQVYSPNNPPSVAAISDLTATAAELNYTDGVTSSIQTQLDSKVNRLWTTSTKTGAYTLALADAFTIIEFNSVSAATFTVPTNASVAFPVGTQIQIENINTGDLTIGGAGITFQSPSGLKLTDQYATAVIRKVATDTWRVAGRTAT